MFCGSLSSELMASTASSWCITALLLNMSYQWQWPAAALLKSYLCLLREEEEHRGQLLRQLCGFSCSYATGESLLNIMITGENMAAVAGVKLAYPAIKLSAYTASRHSEKMNLMPWRHQLAG